MPKMARSFQGARQNYRFRDRRACSTNLRTASGREGFGAACPAIQASSARSSAGGKRVLTGVASTRGRPRPLLDFLALDIDFMTFRR